MNPVQAIDNEIARLQAARRILTGESEPKRLGRPPKNKPWEDPTLQSLATAASAAGYQPYFPGQPKKRKPRTPEQKQAQAKKMREYWAARKKKENRSR